MADPDEILSILQDLVNAYPGKHMSDANFKIYIEHLSDIHSDLLQRAVDNLISKSTWFPRVSEIRSEASKLVGSRRISTWEPPQNYLRIRYYDLERDFYHRRKINPDAWLQLADDFDKHNLIYSAENTRRRLAIFQKMLVDESVL